MGEVMSILKETISTANRAISAVQSVADAVIALPEAIHEARSILVEQSAEKHLKLVKLLTEKDWKIDELESELATLRTKTELSIPGPDVGEGFETCSRDDATEVNWKIDGCSWDEHWYSVSAPFAWDNEEIRVYRFRRPIAKWLACTAEEASANPGESEWLDSRPGDLLPPDWLRCSGLHTRQMAYTKERAYRSTAKLPEWVEVTRERWENGEFMACEKRRIVVLHGQDNDSWTREVKRATVEVGTVLG
jgi:hypothetical protein